MTCGHDVDGPAFEGSNGCAMLVDNGKVGELEDGSSVSAASVFSMTCISYAMNTKSIWRHIMNKSSERSRSFDGT